MNFLMMETNLMNLEMIKGEKMKGANRSSTTITQKLVLALNFTFFFFN
jgi:hypothetical protein